MRYYVLCLNADSINSMEWNDALHLWKNLKNTDEGNTSRGNICFPIIWLEKPMKHMCFCKLTVEHTKTDTISKIFMETTMSIIHQSMINFHFFSCSYSISKIFYKNSSVYDISLFVVVQLIVIRLFYFRFEADYWLDSISISIVDWINCLSFANMHSTSTLTYWRISY